MSKNKKQLKTSKKSTIKFFKSKNDLRLVKIREICNRKFEALRCKNCEVKKN